MIFKYGHNSFDFIIRLSYKLLILHQNNYCFNFFCIYLTINMLFFWIIRYLKIDYQFYEIKTKIHTFFSSLRSFFTKFYAVFSIKFIIICAFLLTSFFFLKSLDINAILIISFYVRERRINIKFIENLFS